MKTKLLWKTIPENFESHGHKWKVRKWFHIEGELKLCSRGFHASEKILNAIHYVSPGWICRVMIMGESEIDKDKSVHSDIMIVKRYNWTKGMSVRLAIYAAQLVLSIYEKKYPNDKRPRNAIRAAKKYLENPTAHAAYAADAAADAAHAAYAAGAREKILAKIEKKIKQLASIK